MPHHSPDISFLSAFANYVLAQREAIGRDWMKTVRESPEVPGALNVSKEALQDHVPELLTDLVDRLRLEEEGTKDLAADHSRSHGREQWKAGYKISDLIWEIYIIRRVLTQTVLADFMEAHPGYSSGDRAKAELLIHDFFHRLTCDSVGQFIVEKETAILAKNLALNQISDSRERLTRTVSHELRNVLNALSFSLSLLREENGGEERKDIGEICARMLSDMSRILNDLLEYSALFAGRAHLQLEHVSIVEVFEEIQAEWQPVAEAQGLIFEGVCKAAIGNIFSDRLKLKQITGNLLSNAIKYRKKQKPGFVRVSFLEIGGHEWRILVEDDGIGIDEENMPSLFGEFNRLRPTSAVSGTGLGLAICKEFSELLGGRIEAFSKPEEGTRFEATLPIRRAATNG